jgi:hypothetical protein
MIALTNDARIIRCLNGEQWIMMSSSGLCKISFEFILDINVNGKAMKNP